LNPSVSGFTVDCGSFFRRHTLRLIANWMIEIAFNAHHAGTNLYQTTSRFSVSLAGKGNAVS
jgi:hypothetical protein